MEKITSKERQYDQFLRIMNDNKLLEDQRLPSEKFKVKEIEAESVYIEKESGEKAKIAYLPTSEMPNKEIFGKMDPLEGSPARDVTRKFTGGADGSNTANPIQIVESE